MPPPKKDNEYISWALFLIFSLLWNPQPLEWHLAPSNGPRSICGMNRVLRNCPLVFCVRGLCVRHQIHAHNDSRTNAETDA